jgi:hypothetical protein
LRHPGEFHISFTILATPVRAIRVLTTPVLFFF